MFLVDDDLTLNFAERLAIGDATKAKLVLQKCVDFSIIRVSDA